MGTKGTAAMKTRKRWTPKKPAKAPKKLRQWAVEMAMRWPIWPPYGGGIAMSGVPGSEVDVIARAERLIEFIQS